MRTWLIKLGLSALLLAPLLVTETGRADACFCEPYPPPLAAAEEADIVFSGTTRAGGLGFVGFDVTTVWKGPRLSTLVIRQPLSLSPHCIISFEAGESYLVYAYRTGERGDTEWSTNLCTRTRLLALAQEDLEELPAFGQGRALPPSPGAVLDETGPVLLIGAGIVGVLIVLRAVGALPTRLGGRRSRP